MENKLRVHVLFFDKSTPENIIYESLSSRMCLYVYVNVEEGKNSCVLMCIVHSIYQVGVLARPPLYEQRGKKNEIAEICLH